MKHLLVDSIGTQPLHKQLMDEVQTSPRSDGGAFFLNVFDMSAASSERYYHIMLVGKALCLALKTDPTLSIDPIEALIREAHDAVRAHH